jgi:putative membrane protein
MSEQIDIEQLDTNNASEAQLAKEIASDEWLRVSPIAILYFLVKTLFFLVNNVLIYMLPLFAFNFSKVKENLLLFALGALAFVVLVLIGSVIKYLFYNYRLSADRVEIRQGMIKKSHLDLPFSKIQNVKIIQPFYYRFSNFSIVELDTAGSAQQEANIVAIRLPIAESFKQKVLAIASNTSSAGLDTKDHEHSTGKTADTLESNTLQEVVLNRRSLKDLIIHGITNNRVWIFLGFLAPFYNAIADNIGNVFTLIGLDIAAYLNYETLTMWVFVLHLFSVVMLIMLAIVLFSIIGSIFVFYDYRLSRHDERYIRRSGLLTKHEVSMKASRIQRAVHQQDWLDLIIGRVNLRFEQNTSGNANAGQAGQINNANKLIVPSVTPLEADELVDDVLTVSALSKVNFKAISPRYIIRLMLFPVTPICLVLFLVGFFNDFNIGAWAAIGGFATLIVGLCVLRWYRWGFAKDEHFIYIRKGLLGRDYMVFPTTKIQQTKMHQTPFMRAKQLATLHIVLASGGMRVPYLPENEVKGVIDEALLKIGRDKPAWM